jgi:hypothetical protein
VKYVVTAINKLSGEREAVSSPRSLEQTEKLLNDHLQTSRYKRHQPWTKFKIEESFEE